MPRCFGGKHMKRFFFAILILFILFDLFAGILWGILFFERIKLPYNSMGRYFDEQTGIVYSKQSVETYGFLLGISFVLIAIAIYLFLQIQKKKDLKVLKEEKWFCPGVEKTINIGLCWEYCFAGTGPTDTKEDLLKWINENKKFLSLEEFHKTCEHCKHCQWSR